MSPHNNNMAILMTLCPLTEIMCSIIQILMKENNWGDEVPSAGAYLGSMDSAIYAV